MPRFAMRVPAGRLDRLLLTMGVTPAQLAEDAGVSEATVSRARAGRPIAGPSAVAIARALSRYEAIPGVEALLPEGGP